MFLLCRSREFQRCRVFLLSRAITRDRQRPKWRGPGMVVQAQLVLRLAAGLERRLATEAARFTGLAKLCGRPALHMRMRHPLAQGIACRSPLA